MKDSFFRTLNGNEFDINDTSDNVSDYEKEAENFINNTKEWFHENKSVIIVGAMYIALTYGSFKLGERMIANGVHKGNKRTIEMLLKTRF